MKTKHFDHKPKKNMGNQTKIKQSLRPNEQVLVPDMSIFDAVGVLERSLHCFGTPKGVPGPSGSVAWASGERRRKRCFSPPLSLNGSGSRVTPFLKVLGVVLGGFEDGFRCILRSDGAPGGF